LKGPSDPAEGRWVIVTRVGEEMEKIYFHVGYDVLLPFQAQVAVQKEMLSSFRSGFPVFGNVIYGNYGSSTKDLVLIVRKETHSSYGLMFSDTTFKTRLKRFIPVTNGRDKYKFVLPPIDFENSASIVVRQVKASDDSNGNESSKINGDDSGQKWISIPPPRQDLEAYKTRVVEKQKITCPGEVKLQVFSNERLPDNTTLMLHFLKRGQLTTRTLKLQSDYTCTSGDSDYGHYECNEDGDIICMSGWTGPDCLTPVCHEGCVEGGICVAPNRCTCKPVSSVVIHR
uniref:DSL domain-containing protein n=1 Tax=Hymenolepis diminuta TaxID=6216 RepID=A0A0R3SY83_HYMDI